MAHGAHVNGRVACVLLMLLIYLMLSTTRFTMVPLYSRWMLAPMLLVWVGILVVLRIGSVWIVRLCCVVYVCLIRILLLLD